MTPASPPITTPEELTQAVKAGFADMSAQFQLGAKYLIDHPSEIATASMRTVASSAQVQASTLVRLAQHLGFDGWPALKQIFVEQVRAVPSGYAKKAKDISRHKNSGSGLLAELFEAQHQNLVLTEKKNQDTLAAAAKTIEAGKQVHIAGFRASFAMAFSFQYLYRLFRPTVQLIGGQAATVEMGLRAVAKDDCVVVISFFPYSEEAVDVARAARSIGCKLVAITDSDASPIALVADHSVIICVESPSFFPSTVAGMATIEGLVGLLVAQGGPAAVKRIEFAEHQLHDSGAYSKKI